MWRESDSGDSAFPPALRPICFHPLTENFSLRRCEGTPLTSLAEFALGLYPIRHHGIGVRILRRAGLALDWTGERFNCAIQLVALGDENCEDLFRGHCRDSITASPPVRGSHHLIVLSGMAGCADQRCALGHAIEEPWCTDEFVEELAIDINARSVVPGCEEVGEVRQVPSLGWVVES